MVSYVLLVAGALLALSLAIVHAKRYEGKRVAWSFFGSVTLYGILRHAAVFWATEVVHGSIFPYQFVRAPLRILGITPLELGGWALVAYLGWQLSRRFTESESPWRLSLAAALFIATASFAIESTAIEARWWFWRVILGETIFGRVPLVGIIDWGFVGIEFLLPYLLWLRGGWRSTPFLLSLLLFPLHFAAHTQVAPLGPIPFSLPDLFHYVVMSGLFLLAVRTRGVAHGAKAGDALLRASFIAIAIVLAIVQLAILGRPDLLVSLVPMTAFALAAAGIWWLGFGLLPFGFIKATVIPSAFPAILHLLLRTRRRSVAWLCVGAFWCLLIVPYRAQYARERTYLAEFAAANGYFKAGDMPNSEQHLRRAIRSSPFHPEAHYLLGTFQRRQGKWEEAAESFRLSLQSLEYNEIAAKMLVASEIMTRRLDVAERELEVLREVHPHERMIQYLSGNVASQLGRKDEAVRFWRQSIADGPSPIDPLMKVQAMEQLGEREEALREALVELKTKPDDEELASWLEQRYVAQGRPDAALAMYDDLARSGKLRSYVIKVAEYALVTGDLDLAEMAYESILRKEPGSTLALEGLERVRVARSSRS